MPKRHNISLIRTSFFISSARKTKSVQEFKISKWNFWSSSFIADDSKNCHVLHVLDFTKHDILHFRDNAICYNILIFSVAQIKQACQFKNFHLLQISKKTDLKFS